MSSVYWLSPDNNDEDFDYEDEHVELESDKDEYDDEDEEEEVESPAARPVRAAVKREAASTGTRDAAGLDQRETGDGGRSSAAEVPSIGEETERGVEGPQRERTAAKKA